METGDVKDVNTKPCVGLSPELIRGANYPIIESFHLSVTRIQAPLFDAGAFFFTASDGVSYQKIDSRDKSLKEGDIACSVSCPFWENRIESARKEGYITYCKKYERDTYFIIPQCIEDHLDEILIHEL